MTSVPFATHILGYSPLDMQNVCSYSAWVCYSPTGLCQIQVINLSLHQSTFACAHMSHQLCYSSDSGIMVGYNMLNELILLI
jgi:hypothetical protein